MSQTAIVSDTHQGARGGSRVFREYMSWWWSESFFPDLKARGIKQVIHGGDFFDNRNSIALPDLDFVVNTFCQHLIDNDIHIYIIVGNHDTAFRNTNRIHSLSMLQKAAPNHVTLVEDELVEVAPFVLVPWINNENYDRIMKQIAEHAHEDSILVGHFEINGMKMYANSMRCETGLDPSIFKDYGKVLSGHFHHPNIYQNIEYIGSPFELTWQDYGDWRGHMVYHHDTNDFERVRNEHQLFNAFTYEDMKDEDDDILRQNVENQFVVVAVNEEHPKLKIRDFIAKLETFKPVSLDIDDKTWAKSDDGQTPEVSEDRQASMKDTKQYIHTYVDRHADTIDKDKVMPVLESLHDEALNNMKDSE